MVQFLVRFVRALALDQGGLTDALARSFRPKGRRGKSRTQCLLARTNQRERNTTSTECSVTWLSSPTSNDYEPRMPACMHARTHARRGGHHRHSVCVCVCVCGSPSEHYGSVLGRGGCNTGHGHGNNKKSNSPVRTVRPVCCDRHHQSSPMACRAILIIKTTTTERDQINPDNDYDNPKLRG